MRHHVGNRSFVLNALPGLRRAIVGRRIFESWIKMLDLLEAGLEVEHLVTDEFEGLGDFHRAMSLLEDRRAMKVVFYPNGKP